MAGLDHFSATMAVFLLNVMTVLAIDDWTGVQLDCPTEHVRWMPPKNVLPGELQRDMKTLPDGLVIRESSIPGGGLGVFSETFIPRYTWFGGYDGEVVVLKADISDYSWSIYRGSNVHYYLDGRDNTTSNWMRFINCSRGKSEENVYMRQCCDVPHYVTNKDIIPGQELLMYYGDKYAKRLNIDTDNYSTS